MYEQRSDYCAQHIGFILAVRKVAVLIFYGGYLVLALLEIVLNSVHKVTSQ
jgi:hypothetical protein